jgi:hypothetical protein
MMYLFFFFSDIFQSMFMDSYPLGISAIAIIRFRLAICRGIADVLVGNMFFNLIVLGCVILSVSTTLLKLDDD